MDRRNFFKIVSTASAGALGACSRHTDRLIPLLVPEHEIVPGEEQWHPAVCTECGAGCATIVRVMEGVRTIQRDGQPVRQRIAAIKKIEGNPLDPISGGRLCARGQASVQSLYHPDRLRGPMKRTGQRGQAQFSSVAWDEAIGQAADAIGKARAADPASIVFLTGGQAGTRSLSIQRFLQALGAPGSTICSITDHAIERRAAEVVFGWKGLPVYDIAHADYVLGVGADFLGGWTSPVYYARQFGQFRQGRRNIRGRLVQAESRLSISAAAADRWLPLRPGTEPQFLAAVGRLLLDGKLARNRDVPAGFESADVGALLAACGLEERRVREVVQELGEAQAPLVIAGASVPHSNSFDAVVASHYLNRMLGSTGVLPPAAPGAPGLDNRALSESLARAQVILIDGANPAYVLPRSSGVMDALSRARVVVSFGPYIDDSAAWSDLLLPDHHALESEMAVVPAVSAQTALAVATPFVEPLYDTRPVEATLAAIATKAGLEYKPATAKEIVPAGAVFEDVAREGGFWADAKTEAAPARPAAAPVQFPAAQFDGDPARFPLLFQPYPSLQHGDGRGANLPWLQELPDPSSSAIWGLPVEIDPQTAASLQVTTGDKVRVDSPHGSFEAPAYVHPGAVPGVVSMAIGDGHTHYGRYASGQGANPISILAPVWEKSAGALALGATRIRLARAGGPRGLTRFSTQDREQRGLDHR
jgi:anaerobic selenocysteine-containing dehydrogenase